MCLEAITQENQVINRLQPSLVIKEQHPSVTRQEVVLAKKHLYNYRVEVEKLTKLLQLRLMNAKKQAYRNHLKQILTLLASLREKADELTKERVESIEKQNCRFKLANNMMAATLAIINKYVVR